MSNDDVSTNYNHIGADVMEMIYADDYLSMGGGPSTHSLAQAANIHTGSHVLDIGSGIGGPALYLAQTFGCRVTGIDLIPNNVVHATARADKLGLTDAVTFEQGDATDMPYPDNFSDVVWGQDAWCHITDKDALIRECARVIKPGGRLAFTDWLFTGNIVGAAKEQLLSVTASPGMGTFEQYRTLLTKHGFAHIDETNISESFTSQYRDVMQRLAALESKIVQRYAQKIYDIVYSKHDIVMRAFEAGNLGGGQFLARRPS